MSSLCKDVFKWAEVGVPCINDMMSTMTMVDRGKTVGISVLGVGGTYGDTSGKSTAHSPSYGNQSCEADGAEKAETCQDEAKENAQRDGCGEVDPKLRPLPSKPLLPTIGGTVRKK